MDVITLNSSKLRISLTYEEISLLFGSYENIDYNNSESKATLNILYKKATELTNFPLDTDRLLIEVKPNNNGCEIYFTKVSEEIKKTVPPKKAILVFKNTDDLIEFSLLANEVKSDLYTLQNKYFIIVYDYGAVSIISPEYCTKIIKNEITAEYIKEHGTVICKTNAIEILKSKFKGS